MMAGNLVITCHLEFLLFMRLVDICDYSNSIMSTVFSDTFFLLGLDIV